MNIEDFTAELIGPGIPDSCDGGVVNEIITISYDVYSTESSSDENVAREQLGMMKDLFGTFFNGRYIKTR